MTQFEISMQQAKEGKIKPPVVSASGKTIDYFWYQLQSSLFYLKIFAAGMTTRQITLKDIKWYYGLKSRSAKDCLDELRIIVDNYKKQMDNGKVDL